MSYPAIKVEGLYKKYKTKSGGKVALNYVDLEIPQGTFFGLLGPNGAGKSTFINILANLVNKTAGKVSICGYDLDKNYKSASKSIGIVPQELVLDPFFPPFEALENTAGYYGIPKSKRRTMEILEALGLKDKAFSPARSLSGGMKRRLLIAKSLVHSPKVLVLDEPTAGVDVELRTQLWDYVRKLNKQGTTIVLTTHYLQEAEELCENIAVINGGRIIANDSKINIMKTIDSKKIIISPNERIDKLPDNLSKFDAVLTVDNNVEITYKYSKINVDEILKEFAKTNLTIRDLSTKEPDLEEVFKYLTSVPS
jgi:ABC-2 type transport system ATP-binding protein